MQRSRVSRRLPRRGHAEADAGLGDQHRDLAADERVESKLQSVGNGAWAGTIPYAAMARRSPAVTRRQAQIPDTAGNTASFVPGHPERLVDYGYRAVHEMTVAAKAIIRAFYGDAPRYSYWNGCSTGGRQGLMEAQRYPADYDGIIAGAPVNARVHQMVWELWVAQAVHKDDASYIPPAKYQRQRGRPRAMRCRATARRMASSPHLIGAASICDAAVQGRRRRVLPDCTAGRRSEEDLLAGEEPTHRARRSSLRFSREASWDGPGWRDLSRCAKPSSSFSSSSPTIRSGTSARSTSIAMWRGRKSRESGHRRDRSKPSAVLCERRQGAPVSRLERPVRRADEQRQLLSGRHECDQGATDSIRLFMMPGMTHCRGGAGPDSFDRMGVIERWVEKGEAPKQIIAEHLTNGVVDRRRPLCPHPEVATYTGAGSLEEAASFVCRTP